MMGNYHVRFLGDKGGVIRLSYPIVATMKQILAVSIFIFSTLNAFSQSIKIEQREKIDSFYNDIILDVDSIGNNFSILSRTNAESGYDYHFYLTIINNNLKIISQKEIPNIDSIFFNYQDCIITKNNIFGLGYIDQEPDEMLPFVTSLNSNLKQNFKYYLDVKHEGNIKGFFKNNTLFVITNNNIDYTIHTFTSSGELLDNRTFHTASADILENVLLFKDYFLIYGWSIKNNQERFDILKLDYKCNLLTQKSVDFSDTPISINKIGENGFAIVFESTPTKASFYDSEVNQTKDITHIRHDYKYKNIIAVDNSTDLYIGLNVDKLTAFLVKDTDVISKVEIGDIGTWGKSVIKQLNKNEFILFTDQKRNSDFESNIEVIKLKIE